MGSVSFAAASHTGRVRTENEDRIALHPEAGLVILADGMGGHQAGEIAATMATELVGTHLVDALGRAEADEPALIAEAIVHANAVIHETSHTRPEMSGMGTTIVLALFGEQRLHFAHVGDSRLYRYRDGRLERLTRDHSVIEELLGRGLLTPDEAHHSNIKNLVTRALGTDPTVTPDVGEASTNAGDLYLLCSDGLTDVLSDVAIARVLGGADSGLQTTVDRLVAAANEGGGPDNVSVVLAMVAPAGAKRDAGERA